ncbi:MAG: cytidylate kinase-like family protein [Candidatus Cellulosilyticum pullistercoris]|uniref:Cytidylate kinase-like family protein n=1 Tax=Candidatus Cellulosilyticum pullistercoris TaxID=2838521 RepID=A0A9E2NLL2_9FIRM|nr:cytidylate kinase-like family protein [Candidatus Cellulosilyticum pullistercoris]
MKQKIIITIGRQYGSGGRIIGKLLAEKLGISFYDKEIIEMAAKKSGMSQEAFEKVDETAASSLLYSIATSVSMFGNYVSPQVDLPLNDKLFIIQSEIIKSIAKKGSCVIVGRCADYILKDRSDIINLFIYADKESRKKRAINEYGISSNKVDSYLHKIDKKRSTYYNHYTGEKWGNYLNYHMCLDSSILGVEGTVHMIEEFIKEREVVLEALDKKA